jgi:hypothetical protein
MVRCLPFRRTRWGEKSIARFLGFPISAPARVLRSSRCSNSWDYRRSPFTVLLSAWRDVPRNPRGLVLALFFGAVLVNLARRLFSRPVASAFHVAGDRSAWLSQIRCAELAGRLRRRCQAPRVCLYVALSGRTAGVKVLSVPRGLDRGGSTWAGSSWRRHGDQAPRRRLGEPWC